MKIHATQTEILLKFNETEAKAENHNETTELRQLMGHDGEQVKDGYWLHEIGPFMMVVWNKDHLELMTPDRWKLVKPWLDKHGFKNQEEE